MHLTCNFITCLVDSDLFFRGVRVVMVRVCHGVDDASWCMLKSLPAPSRLRPKESSQRRFSGVGGCSAPLPPKCFPKPHK